MKNINEQLKACVRLCDEIIVCDGSAVKNAQIIKDELIALCANTASQTQPRKCGMVANDKHVLSYNLAEHDVAIAVSADRQTLHSWRLTGTVDGREVIIAYVTGGTTLARTCCYALCKCLMGYRMRNRRKRQLRAARAAAAAAAKEDSNHANDL